MKKVMKATKIIAKVLEVLHWFAAAGMALTAFCTFGAPQWSNLITYHARGQQLDMGSVYGFEASLTDAAGNLSLTALCLAAIGAAIIYALMAMIFRNIFLIIRRSEKRSPFEEDSIRMVREIGIFSIAIPVIGLIMSVIIRLVIGPDLAETSVNLSGFVTGIVVLSLTQFFAYGARLEKEMDGLL